MILMKDAGHGMVQAVDTEEQGLPETVRETIPNKDGLSGTLAIFCIGDTIEVKARGLTPRQILKVFAVLIEKIFL
jgi:hypothetical protein